MNPRKILIAEDSKKIADSLADQLRKAGYETIVAYDGREAETQFMQHKFSVILLDINLPFKNGHELCKSFRKTDKNVPIIMLTALGELDDKMEAFETGADDYMVKPFHVKELMARIQVFLKRASTEVENEKFIESDLVIDFDKKSVKRGNTEIHLTSREFSLLGALVRSKGNVVSKAQLCEQVWGLNFDTGTNTVEVYISFLRNKLDKPFATKFIQTKQGFGYYFKEQ